MIAYGYSIEEHDDPYVGVVEAAVKGFSETLEPGAYLVDIFPLREPSFLRSRNAEDANPVCDQSDMYLTGSPELGGRPEAGNSPSCGPIRRIYPFNP